MLLLYVSYIERAVNVVEGLLNKQSQEEKGTRRDGATAAGY